VLAQDVRAALHQLKITITDNVRYHRSNHRVGCFGHDQEGQWRAGKLFMLPDQSIHIPAGTAHRLSNPSAIDCKKTGIVRFEDKQ
jgi:hypothetical protein